MLLWQNTRDGDDMMSEFVGGIAIKRMEDILKQGLLQEQMPKEGILVWHMLRAGCK